MLFLEVAEERKFRKCSVHARESVSFENILLCDKTKITPFGIYAKVFRNDNGRRKCERKKVLTERKDSDVHAIYVICRSIFPLHAFPSHSTSTTSETI